MGNTQELEEYHHYFKEQERLAKLVVMEDQLAATLNYIAGTDVAYDDASNQMVGAIVVLNAQTFEVVEQSYHRMEVTFPYIPGLFSFREIPPLLEAFKKLNIKPDLIVCDAQGIAHPRGVGMATHLGLELDIPTIGCAKKRLFGLYEKESLGIERGSTQELKDGDRVVGKALRSQNNVRPLFVSIGHRIGLDTAIEWVLRLTPDYRLPETTRQADHLVNELLKVK